MKTVTCSVSGEKFQISDLEIELRQKAGFDTLPTTAPWVRMRHRGAFWPHWHLYRRKCDRTGQFIISVFSPDCPYPVWYRKEWLEHADPPSAEFDPDQAVFPQMWEFFQRSPLPHKNGTGNQNCEYSDDCWYSKNCYLAHSIVECEDLKYCYRILYIKDCQFCAFTFHSELCTDAINCYRCFDVRYALHCRNCHNCSFLYDCRNCSDCLFCFNLRNKQYCIGNRQLTKEQFEMEKKKWNFASRTVYDQAKEHFAHMMKTLAWHRAAFVDKCHESTGNFLDNCKNCHNCYFTGNTEDGTNGIRGDINVKSSTDMMGFFESELLCDTVQVQDKCYTIQASHNCTQCRFCTYCAYCFQCEHCFGCCGLVGKKYHIFNRKYSPKEYEKLRAKIVEKMKETGEWTQFFPGYFAPNPYDESWSINHFPLTDSEKKTLGFRLSSPVERRDPKALSPDKIPDTAEDVAEELSQKVFWDPVLHRPFKILKADIAFAQKMQVPLPNTFYTRRLRENFAWLFFDGKMRETTCGRSGAKIHTTWPEEYDGRILSEAEYLKVIG